MKDEKVNIKKIRENTRNIKIECLDSVNKLDRNYFVINKVLCLIKLKKTY